MSRNWVLALIAAVIWGAAYTWYFVGVARMRTAGDRLLRALRLRHR